MEEQRKTVVEIVNGNPKFQSVIKEYRENKFLLEGVYHPLAYLIDADKIESAWKKNKSKINAIAQGMALYNDFFTEAMNSVLLTGDSRVSKETSGKLEKWKGVVEKLFQADYKEIEEMSSRLGQYLEFMNRKSQGF
ncbi:MAG: hypothetical protein LHV68_09940 [Elusimicrobia bacterium]|nr:hypothetical protein [Candidatus Liberimonas magnetica]